MLAYDKNNVFLNLILRILLLAVLFSGALFQVNSNLDFENLIKFSIFICLFLNIFKWQGANTIVIDNRMVTLLLLFQVLLCFLGYFNAELTSQFGSIIGFHINDAHLVSWSREPFDPLKRSFSIFDNPNIAGRLLVLTFIAYSVSVGKVSYLLVFAVVLALITTGSRAAIGVLFLFFVWGAVFQIQNRKIFCTWIVATIVLLIVALFFIVIDLRIFSIEKLIISATYKIDVFNMVLSNEASSGVYDTDIALVLHQFGVLGLVALLGCFAVAINLKSGPQLVVLLYCFSGSLIFSTPTLALLFILSMSMKIQQNDFGYSAIFGRTSVAHKPS